MKEKARQYPMLYASIRRMAPAVTGVTTVYFDGAHECALFAPNTKELEKQWQKVTDRPFNRRIVQRVVYFQQKHITRKRRRTAEST